MAQRLTVMAGLLLVLSMLLAACGEEDIDQTPANGGGSPADPTATVSQAPDKPELDGTAWLLNGFSDRDLDSDIVPTLAFNTDDLHGFAGCNDYGAQYTVSADGSFALEDLHQTDMDCETGMDIEGEYLQSLSLAVRYAIDDTRLELQGADGKTLLVFMKDEAPTDVQLNGTFWILDTFNDKPVPEEFEDITLRFDDDSAGGTVCNSYGGSYTVSSDNGITFADIFQTEMYCTEPDGLMDFEMSYLDALTNDVTAYQVANGVLSLIDENGDTLMTFVEDEISTRQPLQDTGWAVVEIDGEPIIEDTEVTLEFDGDGRLTGNGGCNGYGGAYTADHDGTFDAHDVAMTLMACMAPEGVMDQETAFHTALREATTYELDGDSLRLLDDNGTVRLLLVSTFDPDEPVSNEPSGLRGTTWLATAINGEPLESAEPYTLQLAVNGPTGKAGCASWWMQFIMESDGSITHETRVPPSVYVSLCEDDDASADTQAYVDTMANSTSYTVDGDVLHLMDDAGTVVLEFRRGLDGGELDGTSWVLTTLNGEAPLDGTNLTLAFDFEWATGEGGCNGVGGAYMVVEPGTVVFAGVGHTDIGCVEPEGIMEQESAYFDTLHQVAGYVLTDDSLQLLEAGGTTFITYEAAPDMYGLENSFWTLTTMNGEPALVDAPPSLEFRPYGISGWSGCNAYGLQWEYITLDETSLVIGDVSTDQQGCDEPISGQEREYHATLAGVESYRLTDKTLEMMNAAGDVVLSFQRVS